MSSTDQVLPTEPLSHRQEYLAVEVNKYYVLNLYVYVYVSLYK